MDPRVKPLEDASTDAMVNTNYDPHFSGMRARAYHESLLFLARFDALMRYYREQKLDFTDVRDGLLTYNRMVPRIPTMPDRDVITRDLAWAVCCAYENGATELREAIERLKRHLLETPEKL